MSSISSYAGSAGVKNFNTGTVTFASPSGATGSPDTTYATSGSQGSNTTTDSLDLYNFGFSLPSGQTVVGIQADYTAKKTQVTARNNAFTAVKLEIGGAVGTPNVVPGNTNLGTTASVYTYGGSTDLWGLSSTLTQSNINSNVENTGPTLGCWFTSAASGSSACTAQVDSAALTIYYTAGGGGGGANQSLSTLGCG